MSPRPAASAARTASGGSVFVTATMATRAASRPARRAAARTSSPPAASRAASSPAKQARLSQDRPDLGERQADHIGERAVHAGDEACPATLDRVRPGLVQWLARRDVALDAAGIEGSKEDARLDRAA